MSTPDFPDGFQGSGPMFAAAPPGSRWYELGVQGVTTYTVGQVGRAIHGSPMGGAAFLDRDQAEKVADAIADGVYIRWDDLIGHNGLTPARAEAERQSDAEAWGGRGPSASYAEWLAEGQEADPDAEAEYEAEWENDWDDADSNAYQARVEAGLEPEAGS